MATSAPEVATSAPEVATSAPKVETDDFLKWFWEGTNGNGLIKRLNSYARQEEMSDRIRREKFSPHIYGVLLKTSPSEIEGRCKAVKVGFTQQSIKKGGNNRIEQIEATLEKEKFDSTPLFVVPIGCVDTTKFHDTEDRIRKKVGRPLRKDKAEKWKLPVTTEWVLTTQKHIDEIKDKIQSKKDEEMSGDLIDIFKGISAPTDLPRKCQNLIQEEKKREEKKREEKKGEKKKREEKKREKKGKK